MHVTIHTQRGQMPAFLKQPPGAGPWPGLPDTSDVERVLFGEKGVVQGIKRDSVVIDCSTIAATGSVNFAERIMQKGAYMIDSPVSGGPNSCQRGARPPKP
jgi:3-hydroxyisobutyrate dehydrogenase-like beta-hydroxyacid dehydrogenase